MSKQRRSAAERQKGPVRFTPSKTSLLGPASVVVAICFLAIVAFVAFRHVLNRNSNRLDVTATIRGDGVASSSSKELSSSKRMGTSVTRVAEIATPQSRVRQRELADALDPVKGGWTSEHMAERVSAQFKRVAKLLEGGNADLHETIDPQFSLIGEQTRTLEEVYRDPAIVVRRELATDEAQRHSASRGKPAANSLQTLRESFAALKDVRIAFKVFRVEAEGDSVAVQAIFQARGRTQTGTVQRNATWHSRWSIDGSEPLLREVRIEDAEEVETLNTPALFVDCTESVLGANASFRQQLKHGSNYWMPRLESYLSPRLLEGHIGISIGDINGDGLDDIYVCQPGGLPNRLFMQNSDGTATDVSAKSGVDILDWSYSSLIIDMDNDGHQDLAVLADSQLLLFAGDGSGQLTIRQRIPSDCEYSLTAADYDNDGDLDLYACNYFADSSDGLAQLGRTDPLHNSNTGGRNVLYRNDGDWRFVDVTEDVGLDKLNQRWSLASAWEDYDNDGDQDLYVVNDFGHNNLYRNDSGRFQELASVAGLTDANQGMSATWADYDSDGWMDVYVSNMYSAAGNRVTFQPNFMTELQADKRGLYQQLARGNSLLRNRADGTFHDVSLNAGVTMGRWAWASLFCDINNDGRDDLLVANGYLTQDSPDDL